MSKEIIKNSDEKSEHEEKSNAITSSGSRKKLGIALIGGLLTGVSVAILFHSVLFWYIFPIVSVANFTLSWLSILTFLFMKRALTPKERRNRSLLFSFFFALIIILFITWAFLLEPFQWFGYGIALLDSVIIHISGWVLSRAFKDVKLDNRMKAYVLVTFVSTLIDVIVLLALGG